MKLLENFVQVLSNICWIHEGQELLENIVQVLSNICWIHGEQVQFVSKETLKLVHIGELLTASC